MVDNRASTRETVATMSPTTSATPVTVDAKRRLIVAVRATKSASVHTGPPASSRSWSTAAVAASTYTSEAVT